jgi:DNA polymerase elongation subunit (family B)
VNSILFVLVHLVRKVLCFNSEYPNIIVSDNFSYETVTDAGIRKDAIEGLLPKVMKQYLFRRTFFKQVMKDIERQQTPRQLEQQWLSQRAAALKTILVSMQGTAGCCWSRLGNVLIFEDVITEDQDKQ